MLEIKIDDSRFREQMRRLAATLKDMTPVMRGVAGIMMNAVEENFEQEGLRRNSGIMLTGREVCIGANSGFLTGSTDTAGL